MLKEARARGSDVEVGWGNDSAQDRGAFGGRPSYATLSSKLVYQINGWLEQQVLVPLKQ